MDQEFFSRFLHLAELTFELLNQSILLIADDVPVEGIVLGAAAVVVVELTIFDKKHEYLINFLTRLKNQIFLPFFRL